MADKLSAKKVALALAGVSAVVYIVCALLIAVAPAFTVSIFGALFHGIDISEIAMQNISLGRTILGFIEIIVLALVVGWLYAKMYNKIK